MIMPNESRTAGLPRAPAMRRRIALTRKQWIGLPVLAAVPVLALAGVFGERSTTTAARSTTIQIFVRYPERFRYRQVQSLEVSVRNVSTSPLDTVRVALDTSYVTRFAAVRIEPAPRTAFVVALTNLKPAETRLVAAELTGDQYGVHQGRVVVTSGVDSAAVALRTIVFP